MNAAAADRPLPAEFQLLRIAFEAFVPADSLLLAKLLSFGLSTNWERELLRAEMARELGAKLAARLDPGYPRGNPAILTPGEAWTGDGLGLAEQIARVRDSIGLAVEAGGSNNWAVTGARSATGVPRCWRATRTCRRACRESPTRWGSISRIASAAGRRFLGSPVCSWARTTTLRGRSPT